MLDNSTPVRASRLAKPLEFGKLDIGPEQSYRFARHECFVTAKNEHPMDLQARRIHSPSPEYT